MDKLEELENKINELASEIEKLKAEKENELWKPKDGDKYWYINTSGWGLTTVWHGDIADESRYALGNVFKTIEEADFRAEQLKVEAELRRFSRPFDEDELNYIIYIHRHMNKINIDDYSNIQCGNIHFASEEIAQKAIDTVGEERIKKYYFGING